MHLRIKVKLKGNQKLRLRITGGPGKDEIQQHPRLKGARSDPELHPHLAVAKGKAGTLHLNVEKKKTK